jgi:SAM-dependent methyltransferase
MSAEVPQISRNFLNQILFGLLSIPVEGPEISDRIVAFDGRNLSRQPVLRDGLIEEFGALNGGTAVPIVRQIPVRDDGTLDDDAVDELLVTVHCEMQRLSEEFQHGRRMAELLNPLIAAIREKDRDGKLRIVDIGCGTGFVLRWLAAHCALPDDLELIGADYNPALVREAQRLAAAEGLACNFKVANAFKLDQPASIYISTGILHHFRGRELFELFAQHNQPGTRAFLHFDFHQSPLAPFGSWLFHFVRMRQPLARYDGVLSAARAYKARELLDTARAAAPDFKSAVYGVRLWGLPVPRAFHSLIGIMPEYHEGFVSRLGSKAASLGVIE